MENLRAWVKQGWLESLFRVVSTWYQKYSATRQYKKARRDFLQSEDGGILLCRVFRYTYDEALDLNEIRRRSLGHFREKVPTHILLRRAVKLGILSQSPDGKFTLLK